MQFAEKMQPQKMGFREYIEALEEERRKIQVFPKELPLSLELVTQAIETCKQQLSGTVAEYNLNGQSECSEQTSMDEGPVFEEFIPIKKRESPDSVEEDDDEEEDNDDDDEEQHSHKHKNTNTQKSDWLRSVQLWNPSPPPSKEDVPRKTNVVEVKRNGGAFQPFQREESGVGKGNASANGKAPSSPPVAATSSTGPVRVENGGGSSKGEEKGQAQRKQRRCWSQELHKRFLHALQMLGGADSATPKQIRELMKVDGLTNDEVKSHLQKFRLHTRRSPIIQNNGNSQTTPLFLVGNIFVQPQEYGAVATSTASGGGELTTVTPPTGIYAPVASHPPPVTHTPIKFKQLEVSHSQHSHSEEERANHSEGDVHSNSHASSSSTPTSPAS
ncbi:transcription factor HHO3-like [Abrus precatorius]|uniref:Transcription factor HHO3-like n=1 Tax=Abrus precatorius TaxID=3816 RepID=A0A8B8LZC0_ABRPR|nr:transcription factor HHO3-like [Abrus precatorius]